MRDRSNLTVDTAEPAGKTQKRRKRPTIPLRLGGILRLCGVVCCLFCEEAQAKEPRDPFVFGPGAAVTAKPVTVEPSKPGPPLIGIVWDAIRPLAIIGDQTVEAGDMVGNWQVVEIRQNGIVVQRGERREFVSPGNPLPSN